MTLGIHPNLRVKREREGYIMKTIFLAFIIISLSVGFVVTASAESALYEVIAVYTGVVPNVTEDGESIIFVLALSMDNIWSDLKTFGVLGAGSQEVLDTALSANSIGASLLILSDDSYLEETVMPINHIYAGQKPIEENTAELGASRRISVPKIIQDLEKFRATINRNSSK